MPTQKTSSNVPFEVATKIYSTAVGLFCLVKLDSGEPSSRASNLKHYTCLNSFTLSEINSTKSNHKKSLGQLIERLGNSIGKFQIS